MIHKPSIIIVVALSSILSSSVLWAGGLQSWDTQINDSSRFLVLSQFNNEAVLDKETGLVWEKSPTASSNFRSSPVNCSWRLAGGRMGWRSPTIEELTSLIDPNKSSPALPQGHPFTTIQSAKYWSTTTRPDFADRGLVADFSGGATGPDIVDSAFKTEQHYYWCVRGGQGLIGHAGN